MKKVDLHVHSIKSDGTLTPTELVKMAKKRKVSAISLTDHDTVNGVEEALKASETYGVEVIPGVEIGADFETEMHILGYFHQNTYKNIIPLLEETNNNRKSRNPKLIKRLNDLGYMIDTNEVENEAKGDIVARPHFAKVLIKKGYFSSMGEVFEKLLAAGKPGYIPKDKLTPRECIMAINEAGGVAVIAHPKLLGISNNKFKEFLNEELIPSGLFGIEVYHPEHSPEDRRELELLCKELNIHMTGGSDYHGDVKSDIEIGIGRGDLCVSYDLLKHIKDAIKPV